MPLHCAAVFNNPEVGKLLISKGVDINAKDIIFQIITKSFEWMEFNREKGK